jgi:hypothetical protein
MLYSYNLTILKKYLKYLQNSCHDMNKETRQHINEIASWFEPASEARDILIEAAIEKNETLVTKTGEVRTGFLSTQRKLAEIREANGVTASLEILKSLLAERESRGVPGVGDMGSGFQNEQRGYEGFSW